MIADRSVRFRAGSRAVTMLALALLALLALLATPAATFAQGRPPADAQPVGTRPTLFHDADGRAPESPAAPYVLLMTDAAPSLSRHLLIGSGVGAAIGTAFALAVISLADCGGPSCGEERVIGVVGHAAAGALIGALAGGVTYLIRR